MTSSTVADPVTARTVRAMRWWDVARLLPLERDLFGAESWSERLFWSELAQTDTRYYLLSEDTDGVVGYAGLCAYPDEAYIQTMAVRRDAWGSGLGAQLLSMLLAEAARRGKDVVGLEVRADNPRAQALYRRFGFEAIAVRKGYYQPSNTDAVVMMLTGVTRRGTGG